VIKRMCDEVLARLSMQLDGIYASDGAPYIPPETLLKGKLLPGAVYGCVPTVSGVTGCARRPRIGRLRLRIAPKTARLNRREARVLLPKINRQMTAVLNRAVFHQPVRGILLIGGCQMVE
jgi:hypothetical protein